MKNDEYYYMQGDVILKKCGVNGYFTKSYDTIPSDAEKIPGNLILKGQSNSHALYGGKFQLYKKDEQVFLEVLEATTLDHVKDHLSQSPQKAEHHAQVIEIGEYFLSIVQEYDHFKEESRQVID